MKNKRAPVRKTSDFGSGTEPHTLVLKKKEAWKLEVSRKSIVGFFARHRVATIAVIAVIVAGIVTRSILVGFASTADFYPSSCLGNWENVQNALGKPDLAAGASAADFTSLNSAAMGTSTAQMFCGNFSGDTDIDTLTGKSFLEADLVLSWSFAYPQSNAGISNGGGADTGDAAATTTATSTVADNASTTAVISTSTGADATSAVTIAPVTSTGTTPAAEDDQAPTSSMPTSTPVVATTSEAISPATLLEDNGTSSDSTTDQSAPPPAPPAPAPTPAPTAAPTDSGTSTDTSPTSWIRNLVGVAYADDVSSTAEDASTTTLAPSSVSLTDASSVVEGTPVAPQPAPISVDTSAIQNIAIPSSTPDAVLDIVYSTDGVTWQPLADIDSANWQQARYPIPISSWQELQHLQVAFIGTGASGTPPVFIDAVGVEVSYADMPDTPQEPTVATDTPSTLAAPAPVAAPQTVEELPSPAQALKQVFDPFAGQQCSISPFSESIPVGGGGSFLLTLTPPPAATSSISKKGVPPAASSSFLYDAEIGSLPAGIFATVASQRPGGDIIGVTTASDVVPGSYNIVVVYKELQQDGSIAPNFCQFNVRVE